MSDEVLILETSKFFRIKIRLNCACWNVSHCAVSSCFFLSFCFCQLHRTASIKICLTEIQNMRAKQRTRRACQKFEEDFFQILWPSQKTQTLTSRSLEICAGLFWNRKTCLSIFTCFLIFFSLLCRTTFWVAFSLSILWSEMLGTITDHTT